MRAWRPVIGLEVHVQLSTESKLFSRAATTASSALRGSSGSTAAAPDTQVSHDALNRGWLLHSASAPNTRVQLFDAAIPGTLPRVNKSAVAQGVRLGLALGGDVRPYSRFVRKHYFYADLPHGYQITQQDEPLVVGGNLRIRPRARSSRLKSADAEEQKEVRIARVQLETDSGKSLHAVSTGDSTSDESLIDLNRAGVGLLEVVTYPDMSSSEEAAAFVKTLQNLVRHTGISTANVDEGELRCDVNVSLQAVDDPNVFGDRCEVKNVNGARYVAKAVEYEVERQMEILNAGGSVSYETRAFDAVNSTTVPMRSKEHDVDYRFMPEPDLPPVWVSPAMLRACTDDLGELPEELRSRLLDAYGLAPAHADFLVESGLAGYFEEVGAVNRDVPSTLIASTISNQLLGFVHEAGLTPERSVLPPVSALGELLALRHEDALSSAGLRILLKELVESAASYDTEGATKPISVRDLAAERGLLQESAAEPLEEWCRLAADSLQDECEAYRGGNRRVMRRLVGEVMKLSKGSANPEETTRILQRMLEK
jgi:aspartyl-tRNA(Asn)/glutamyl-tRNA(Gln) amidotransferase subunit B